MNTPAALDDYLLDLLGDAAAPAATPSTPHVVAVATVDAVARQTDATAAAPPLSTPRHRCRSSPWHRSAPAAKPT